MTERPPLDTPEPGVVLDVDYTKGAFELVLVNVGDHVAHDVSVEFSRPLIGARNLRVSELPLFRRVGVLRPGREVRVFLDSATDLFRRRKSNTFRATVTWRDGGGQAHQAQYRHDLDAYRGFPEVIIP
jgi:hypothetical protein